MGASDSSSLSLTLPWLGDSEAARFLSVTPSPASSCGCTEFLRSCGDSVKIGLVFSLSGKLVAGFVLTRQSKKKFIYSVMIKIPSINVSSLTGMKSAINACDSTEANKLFGTSGGLLEELAIALKTGAKTIGLIQ